MKRQEIEKVVIQLAEKVDKFQVSQVLDKLDKEFASRQYISGILSDLVTKGALVVAGSKRFTFYSAPSKAGMLIDKETRTLLNKGLTDHLVYEEITSKSVLAKRFNDTTSSIVNFAFTEMLNNAIEHSRSDRIKIEFYRDGHDLVFTIRDFGVGVFENVKKKYGLNSDLEAIQELLKGKTTTEPKAHSGEGIFFTSKSADEFLLESFMSRLRVDNKIEDVFVESRQRSLRGTKVTFRVNLHSSRHLSDIFKKYYTDPESFAFDKTIIMVKLYTMGTVYVSRSQARRVLSNVEKKFKVIILDFDKVPTIGQAFADEVFRVFGSKHPSVEVRAINMNDNVEFMIKRARSTGRMLT
jgi:anti-sigma regulatory factor (Ser/Thr protein kinase)/predicted transcriptional regulator